ncbi:unnamed protein product [Peniophora sp. CBMAI 1063]|nr:unnamed protein product [Peniophora sp. CBMAI 1063]
MSASPSTSTIASLPANHENLLKRKREPEPFDWSSWTSRKRPTLEGRSSPNELLHATIDELNAQTFPFGLLSRADDLLAHCLLQNKGSSLVGGRSPVVTPSWPLHDRTSIASLKERIAATNIIHKRDAAQSTQSIHAVAQALLDIPAFQLRDGWIELRQLWIKTLIHLLRRYAIFFTPGAPVRPAIIRTLSLGTVRLTYGLKSCQFITSRAYLFNTFGSVSSNIVDLEGVLAVRLYPAQRGAIGVRAVSGPLRLVTHDCRPNAEVCPVPDSHAFVLRALVDIPAGAIITVNTRGLPFSSATNTLPACWCRTCAGVDPDDRTLTPKPVSPR